MSANELEGRQAALVVQASAACVALALGGVLHILFAGGCLLFVLFKHNVLDRLRLSLPYLVFVFAHAVLFLLFLLFAVLSGLGGDDLAVLLGFAMLWMLLRLFAESTPYNDFLIVLSALVITVGSAGAAGGLLPVGITVVYLLAACYTMPTIMARRDSDSRVTVRLVGKPGGWAVATAFAVHHLSLGGLLLGSFIYLVVPRLDVEPGELPDLEAGEGLLSSRLERAGTKYGTGSGADVTGFPSTVRLGQIGAIKRSDKRSFDAWLRVRGVAFDPPAEARTMLLLRADAWDTYDPVRRTWSRWEAPKTRLDASGVIASGEAVVDWTILLHRYDGKKLFLPARPRRIRCSTRPLFIDPLGRVTSPDGVRKYSVEAAMPVTDRRAIERLRPTSQRRLMHVDAGLARALWPYARELGLTERASQPVSGQILRVTDAIRTFFYSRRFRYTLQLPELPRGADPVVAFLERREGHCELYATAACLFLRMAGIPARLAGGARCAERLDKGYYRARFRNAHAWVEVACRQVGFVAFDFTPPDSRAVEPSGSTAKDADPVGNVEGNRTAAAGGLDWRNPFRYGPEQQHQLALAFRAKATFLLPVVLLGVAVLLAGVWLRGRVRARVSALVVRAPPGVRRRTLAFYVRWLKECSARGYRRSRSQTPREFLAGLPEELLAEGTPLTERFEALRYGARG